MTYFYSKEIGGFICDEITSKIPADAIRITDEYHQVLLDKQSKGYEIIANDNTVLAVIPEQMTLTLKEKILRADNEKAAFIAIANEKMGPLIYSSELNMITTEEAEHLKAWKKYSVLLHRIDTSTAPDINWPVMPI